MNDETNASGNDEQTDDQATPAGTGDGSTEGGDVSIPKARLDAEIAKRKKADAEFKDLQARLAKYEEQEKKAADDEAQRKGLVEEAQKERDRYKADAEAWATYAKERITAIGESLTESQQAILDELGDDVPLARKLKIAEKLANDETTQSGGVGSNGGRSGGGDASSLIPPSARKSRAAFDAWLTQVSMSGDPEQMAILIDPAKKRKLDEEVARLFA